MRGRSGATYRSGSIGAIEDAKSGRSSSGSSSRNTAFQIVMR